MDLQPLYSTLKAHGLLYHRLAPFEAGWIQMHVLCADSRALKELLFISDAVSNYGASMQYDGKTVEITPSTSC